MAIADRIEGRDSLASTRRDEEAAELLDGAVDLHVHPSPSPFPRRIGIFEAATQARDAGFRAIFVKSHHHSMVSDLHAIREAVGTMPIPVFSGVALNNQVGGINPYAVELALQQGGRIVWFPTIASSKHICVHDEHLKFPTASLDMRESTALSIRGDDGTVRDEVLDILALIKEQDAILAGGHLDVEELDLLIRTAHGMGIERILVNHPNFVVGATPQQCAEWVELGVYFEHSLCMYDERSTFFHWKLDVLLEYIAAVGVQRTLLCSDLGQANNPLPVEAYEVTVRGLLDAGVDPRDIRLMVGGNAADVAGL
ncbi:MAG: DUF6282 family protein [Actinomycetes bacterium]